MSNTFACVQTQFASDGTEIVTAMYYDQKGRVVEKNSKLLGNHLRREQFTYTFTGKVLIHTIIDYKGTKEIFRSTTTNNYDATTGILLSQTSPSLSVYHSPLLLPRYKVSSPKTTGARTSFARTAHHSNSSLTVALRTSKVTSCRGITTSRTISTATESYRTRRVK